MLRVSTTSKDVGEGRSCGLRAERYDIGDSIELLLVLNGQRGEQEDSRDRIMKHLSILNLRCKLLRRDGRTGSSPKD